MLKALRLRQARPAQPARHRRRHRRVFAARTSTFKAFKGGHRARRRGPGDPGAGCRSRNRAASSTSSTTGRAARAHPGSATSSKAKAKRSTGKGPIAKFRPPERRQGAASPRIVRDVSRPASAGCKAGDAVFFVLRHAGRRHKLAGAARLRIGSELELTTSGTFEFCWIVDFPMYEWNEDDKKIDFSHNPVLDAADGARRLSGARRRRRGDDPRPEGLPVRHRLQRRGAVVRRDPEPLAPTRC